MLVLSLAPRCSESRRKMRHFESIFLSPAATPNTFRAQVFDLAGELDFAGHPLLGAASVLHSRFNSEQRVVWTFLLRAKTVNVTTDRGANGFSALLDQGRPEFFGEVPPESEKRVRCRTKRRSGPTQQEFPIRSRFDRIAISNRSHREGSGTGSYCEARFRGGAASRQRPVRIFAGCPETGRAALEQ
jgi:hypothetical protein